MPDYNPSVALGVNAPDPNQGLNTLSKILGMGQQGLAIQGQKSQNQSLAAQAAINTQSATENQNLARLMSDPVGNGIIDGDGNPTKNAQQIVMAAAPTTGSQHYSDFVNAATNKVAFNSALNNLKSSERADVLQNYAGAAAGADSPDDIKSVGAQLLAAHKGTPEEGQYQDIVNGLNEQMDLMVKHQNASGKLFPPGQEPWRGAVLNATRAGLPEGATVGPGGLATPQGAQIDTGAAIQPGVTRPAIQGGAFTPAGAPIAKATPPTVTTNATGQLVRVAPGGTGASVVPTQAPPGVLGAPAQNANPTAAQAVGQVKQAQGIGDRIGQVQAQAANTVQAQDALSRAKAILESGQSPDTGSGFENKKAIANFLSSVGIDSSSADNMNTLAKNLARYEASRATASGLGGTDAARELAHNGSPNTQLDNRALLGIVRQSLASEKVLSGYADVQSKTNDPQKQLQNEAAFRAIPHPIETTEYMMSRNKAEAEQYLAEHGLKHSDIAQSAAALQQFGSQ
jgi:hypothetical protein